MTRPARRWAAVSHAIKRNTMLLDNSCWMQINLGQDPFTSRARRRRARTCRRHRAARRSYAIDGRYRLGDRGRRGRRAEGARACCATDALWLVVASSRLSGRDHTASRDDDQRPSRCLRKPDLPRLQAHRDGERQSHRKPAADGNCRHKSPLHHRRICLRG